MSGVAVELVIAAAMLAVAVFGIVVGGWLGVLVAVAYGLLAVDLARHALRLRRLRREVDDEGWSS